MAGQAAGNASCHLATGVPEMSMIPDETPTAPARGIGDNQPPSPIETLVAAQKEAQTTALEERLAYIVGRADAKDIVDRETAGQADRKSVGKVKSVSVRVDFGGGRFI